MRSWVWIVVAACAGPSELPAPKPPAAPVIAPTSCADAGVILRGKVASSDETAGPAREAAIAGACRDDHWSPPILACIGGSRTPQSCVDSLPPLMAASYQAHLAEWSTRYAESSDLDEPPPETACDEVSAAIVRLSDDVSLEHDWVVDARKRMVERECRSWHEPTKQCFVADAAPPDLPSCVADDDRAAFVAKLAEITARAAKMSAAKQKPATITCAKVAATYYADAAWKGKLDDAKPAERKKAITGSRAAMQTACTGDKWDDTTRACLVTGGGSSCFDATTVAAGEWGFPARATIVKALPPLCLELERRARTVMDCATADPGTRASLWERIGMIEREAEQDPVAVVAACREALDELGQPTCP